MLAGAALLLALAALAAPARGDFVFLDFNSTQTLAFVADATTSTCAADAVDALDVPGEAEQHTESVAGYAGAHGASDAPEAALAEELHEKEQVELRSVETNVMGDAAHVDEHLAGLGHRQDGYAASPTRRCPGRLRLTPSAPHRRGAVWAQRRMQVLNGFETAFTFQISDPSRACTEVRDFNFGLQHHTSCAVHGGDGFAFVLHAHSNGTRSVGRTGAEMGYGGITNSLAIEFDTWHNAENQTADVFDDHVAVHSNGVHTNHAGASTLLAGPAPTALADGKVHSAVIRYHDFLHEDLVPHFSAQPALTRFMLDLSEGRRLGSMAVFVDGSAEPLLAFPINLAVVLDLPQSSAYVGFAAGTGRSWQKADVLSWYFCEETPCLDADAVGQFDYHMRSHGWDTAYAGTVANHQYADTSPVVADQVHFADERNEGLV